MEYLFLDVALFFGHSYMLVIKEPRMNLTSEEKNLLESYEKGEWVSVKNLLSEKKT
jgi:hypothetical protein